MQPASLQLAVFDLDGTLVHLEHEHFIQRIEHTLSTVGLAKLPRARIEEIVRSQRLDELFPETDRAAHKQRFWDSYTEGEVPDPRPFEHAVYALEEAVARGLKVAIATARKTPVEDMIERLAPTNLLKHVHTISTWHGTNWTDKHEQLARLCQRLQVAPRHAMMVGDAPHDIRSATHNGFALRIAVSSHATPQEAVAAENPDAIIPCISHVPRIVDEYLQGRALALSQ